MFYMLLLRLDDLNFLGITHLLNKETIKSYSGVSSCVSAKWFSVGKGYLVLTALMHSL